MQRILEPELMEDALQCEAYAHADFQAPNAEYLERLYTHLGDHFDGPVVDLGCGPAHIPIQLCQNHPSLHIWAVDGSQEMLQWARKAAQEARVANRITCRTSLVPVQSWSALGSPTPFRVLLSNSLLHHLHNPMDLWTSVHTLCAPGAWVLIGDLLRPTSVDEAHAIVHAYSKDEPEVLRRDFFNSLCAAFSLDEIRDQLRQANLPTLHVEQVSDRHLFIFGQLPDSSP